jgi:uncharacterized membrane protein
MLGFGYAVYDQLPPRVPIHWNIRGEADGWSGRTFAVLLTPVLCTGLWLLFVGLLRWSEHRGDAATVRRAVWLVANLTFLFLGAVHVLILGNALGWRIDVTRVILTGAGLIVAAAGAATAHIPQNPIAGIRTPWTLSDAEVWRQTHRVGGPVLAAAGLISTAGGLLLPPVAAFVLLMTSVLGAGAGLIAYSYVLWRRRHRPDRAHG